MRCALTIALVISAVAALADWRTGKIHNWITLPPAAGAPIAYGVLLGPRVAALSIASLLLCAVVPYGLFRCGAMGGGDVKLFAALGATTGAELETGLEIELTSLLVATLAAMTVLVWKGRLVGYCLALARGRYRGAHRSASDLSLTPIRLGGAIFAGTTVVILPTLLASGVSP
ncbi:MAG: A24 family peptidase [Polyangiales bacterium]